MENGGPEYILGSMERKKEIFRGLYENSGPGSCVKGSPQLAQACTHARFEASGQFNISLVKFTKGWLSNDANFEGFPFSFCDCV